MALSVPLVLLGIITLVVLRVVVLAVPPGVLLVRVRVLAKRAPLDTQKRPMALV